MTWESSSPAVFKGPRLGETALSPSLIGLADRWYWGTAVTRGSGLSREQIGTSNLGLSCLWESPQWAPGVPRMPSPLFDSSGQGLLRACLPHTSHPGPIKPVCLAAATSTGCVFKCCSNAPPGKLTPRRFTSLFRAHAKFQSKVC